MEKNKPIKRHKALQPLSRQHHFGLLFSWKLRKGFTENIEIKRLKDYANWFFKNEIQPHFKDEEQHIFPILDTKNELICRALNEHRRIESLFNDTENPEISLHALEHELEAHIRFEERILFNEIQKIATEEQLQKIEEIHVELSTKPEYHDVFWGK